MSGIRVGTVEGVCQHGDTTTAFSIVGRGPALVLAHGAEADRRMFDDVVPALATAATVITYDQRDCGASTTSRDGYGVEDLADDLVALLDHLELSRADILGQSFGGVIAELVAVRHPSRVDRLVLASTFRAGTSLSELNPEGVARLLALREHGSDRERAELFLTPDFVRTHAEALDAWTRIAPVTTAEQRTRRATAMQRPVELIALGTIVAPTLVVHGTADAIIPLAHARENVKQLADGDLRELDGVGHVSPLQAPDALAGAILDHLARRPRSAT
jgi:pimeloyl-ACP methyl ester carboxylesterase